MATEGERLATVEAVLREVQGDVSEIKTEIGAARQRLHSLEGISSAFLAWQKDARLKEAKQYRRLGNIVGLGGLALSVALVVLAVVTFITHHG